MVPRLLRAGDDSAARLGLVTGGGLREAVRETVRHPVVRVLAAELIVGAIGFGNAAFF